MATRDFIDIDFILYYSSSLFDLPVRIRLRLDGANSGTDITSIELGGKTFLTSSAVFSSGCCGFWEWQWDVTGFTPGEHTTFKNLMGLSGTPYTLKVN